MKGEPAVNLDQLKVSNLPVWVLAVIGLVLLFIGYKAGKFLLKLAFILLALALIGGAVWWYFQHH